MRNSRVLKALAYIFIPIILVAIIINFVCIMYVSTNIGDTDNIENMAYVETDQFADDFYMEIRKIQNYIINSVGAYDDPNSICVFENIYSEKMKYKFLLVRKSDNAIFSNITTGLDDIEPVKEYLKSKNYYFFYEGMIIDTNIKNNELYNKDYSYSRITYTQPVGNMTEVSFQPASYSVIDFDIYIGFSDEEEIGSNVFWEKAVFDYVKNNATALSYLIPIYVVLEILLLVYLLWSIGHRKGSDEIYQTRFDKWPIEIILAIGVCSNVILIWLISIFSDSGIFYRYTSTTDSNVLWISLLAIVIAVIYAITAIVGTSIVKKIKTRYTNKNKLNLYYL